MPIENRSAFQTYTPSSGELSQRSASCKVCIGPRYLGREVIPLGVLNSSKIRKAPSWSPINETFRQSAAPGVPAALEQRAASAKDRGEANLPLFGAM